MLNCDKDNGKDAITKGIKAMMDNSQIERIRIMESYLDDSETVIRELSDALLKYEEKQELFYKLEDYYGSASWIDDYEADEEGKIPDDLKRGVLSEDTVYDLIRRHRELMTRLQRAVLRSMEEK